MEKLVRQPNPRRQNKSRRGCLACKTRRVKCCEGRPVCQNCLRRGETCEYTYRYSHHCHHARSDELGQATARPVIPLSSDMAHVDLKLLDNFLKFAKPILPMGNTRKWLTDVPRRARQTPFVMHAILALSASHLSTNDHAIPGSLPLLYRQKAIEGISQALRHADTRHDTVLLDSIIAASYALAHQACYLQTGSLDSLAFHRGIQAINDLAEIQHVLPAERLFNTEISSGQEFVKLVTAAQGSVTDLDNRILFRAEYATLALRTLCDSSPVFQTLCDFLLADIRLYPSELEMRWKAAATKWDWLMKLSAVDQAQLTCPDEPLAALLRAYWFTVNFLLDRTEVIDEASSWWPVTNVTHGIELNARRARTDKRLRALAEWPLQVARVLKECRDKAGWMSIAEAFALVKKRPWRFI